MKQTRRRSADQIVRKARRRRAAAGIKDSGRKPAATTNRDYLYFAVIIVLAVFITALVFHGIFSLFHRGDKAGRISRTSPVEEPSIKEDYLTVSEYNRPGIALKSVHGIVIHYVSNPGSTAQENRDYFENLSQTHLTKASCHFLVGLEGEILQLIPLDEIAYCSNEANSDTISIECCHPKKDGKFSDETYKSAVHLTAWLCYKYGLDTESVIRHYDVTGKMCPKYYVEHEEAWQDFLKDVRDALN